MCHYLLYKQPQTNNQYIGMFRWLYNNRLSSLPPRVFESLSLLNYLWGAWCLFNTNPWHEKGAWTIISSLACRPVHLTRCHHCNTCTISHVIAFLTCWCRSITEAWITINWPVSHLACSMPCRCCSTCMDLCAWIHAYILHIGVI